MSRDYSEFLRDIVKAADEISQFLAEIASPEALAGDQLRLYAIAYALQIIGEAVKNIPQEIREKYPEVEWRGAAGLRDVIAHAYFKIDAGEIWSIAVNDLPVLRQQVVAILTNDQ